VIRFPWFIVLLTGAAFVAVVGSSASPQDKKAGMHPGSVLAFSDMPALPGYYLLRMEHVQKELNLTREQVEKLKELGRKYYEQIRGDQDVWKNWRQMTPEERSTKAAELREKYKKRAEDLRKKIEKVLLPQQIQALKEINFRAAGPSALANPRILDSLGVSDQQKEKLESIRQEMLAKYQELQTKAFDRALKVLTPEQCRKLKVQLLNRGY
jgi:Spy/CpxP family protein refolding chaperone